MFSRTISIRRALVRTCVGAGFAVALLAGGSTAHAQGYGTNFNDQATYGTNGGGGSLSGRGGWDSTDLDKTPTTPGYAGEYVGQSDYVGTVTNYSNPAANYWAYLGGLQHGTNQYDVLPGSTTSYLFHSLSVAGVSAYTFNVDFSISSSTTYPNRDSFGWTFRTATTNLFSLNFTPATATPTKMDIGYTVNGATPATTQTNFAVIKDGIYHLTISVNVATKLANVSLTPSGGTAQVVASNISLATIDPTAITQVAATWILNPTVTQTTDAAGGYTTAGGNALLFDNYSVVPEPSTWALLGVGMLGGLVLARRRARA